MAVTELEKDPYSQPSFSAKNRIARALWGVASSLLFRPSPRPLHGWRSFLLKSFGAKLGPGCHIYPKAQIWAPWNLVCEDVVAVADGAIVYNPSPVVLGSHATISQEAYLCGASHDYKKPDFPLISAPIHVGAYAWVCARATVQMGVNVGEGAIVATGGVATKDIEPWTIWGGVPAKQIGIRPRTHSTGQEYDEDHHKNGQGKVALGR